MGGLDCGTCGNKTCTQAVRKRMGPGLCLDYTCKADLPCRDVVADQALGDEGPFPNLQVLCPSAGPLQWGLQPPPTTAPAFPSHCSAGQLLSLFPCTVCTPRRCSSARGRPFTALGLAGQVRCQPNRSRCRYLVGRHRSRGRILTHVLSSAILETKDRAGDTWGLIALERTSWTGARGQAQLSSAPANQKGPKGKDHSQD